MFPATNLNSFFDPPKGEDNQRRSAREDGRGGDQRHHTRHRPGRLPAHQRQRDRDAQVRPGAEVHDAPQGIEGHETGQGDLGLQE